MIDINISYQNKKKILNIILVTIWLIIWDNFSKIQPMILRIFESL